MRTSPSIAPHPPGQDTYLVLDDFGGRQGRSWRETDEAQTDRAALMIDLLDGQYNDPVRVIAFNADEAWCRDASQEIADLIAEECRRKGDLIPPFLESFVDRHGSRRAASLPPRNR